MKIAPVLKNAALAALVCAASASLLAQDAATDANNRRRRGSAEDTGGRATNPADMQARLMTAMRERFEVTDDEEWKLIAERIAKVTELRRSAGGGMGGFAFAGRGGQGTPGGAPDTRGRGATAANPEVAALSAAVRDKLPDAEIKSRLDRVRETRKANEAKLGKAQEDLRAVLSVRQEAVAVVFGLLP